MKKWKNKVKLVKKIKNKKIIIYKNLKKNPLSHLKVGVIIEALRFEFKWKKSEKILKNSITLATLGFAKVSVFSLFGSKIHFID